ncbi:MAG: tetratricopeptide repeat protein [Anaerolineae bacterium]|nr:tetratricopeptide repeat protein [Anaerolineae bacterium]
MSNQQINRMRYAEADDGVAPPPRLLLGLAIALLGLFAIGIIAALLVMILRPAPSQLLEIGIIAVPVIVIGTLLASVLFRRWLPRRFTVILVALWLIAAIVGGTAFIVVFRNNLAPGQRETVKNYLPFMEIFAPPLPPADTSLPTPMPESQSGISAEDLLSDPLGSGLSTPLPPTELPQVIAPTTPSQEPTQAATVMPTATPVVTATLPPTQAAIAPTQANTFAVSANLPPVRPSAHRLYGITAVKQGWNNCGPANITMALSYYGWKQDQEVAVSYLKPDREDKNVNPWELVDFVRSQSGVLALTRIGGDMELLKQIISNGFPVVIETGYLYEGSDWLGHYQTVVGYDDALRVFYIYDSYLGAGENGSGIPESYEDFDRYWQNFNRTFVVLYRAEEEITIRTLLGDRADVTRAAEIALQTAQEEARANPQNAFAWFNLGSSFAALGEYEKAASAFDKARQLGTLPWRITLYQFGPFESYYNVGRYDDIVFLVDSNFNNGGQYVEEIWYWQGKVLAARGETAQAASSFRQALQRHPGFAAAAEALKSLPAT